MKTIATHIWDHHDPYRDQFRERLGDRLEMDAVQGLQHPIMDQISALVKIMTLEKIEEEVL